MLQRYFFAGCAPLPTNGYSLLHHYHFLGSFVSKNNFEHKMFVLQHFFACIFCQVRTCNGCWNTSRKSTQKRSRLVLQIATSNTVNCPEQFKMCSEQWRRLPRAVRWIAPSNFLPCRQANIPNRTSFHPTPKSRPDEAVLPREWAIRSTFAVRRPAARSGTHPWQQPFQSALASVCS